MGFESRAISAWVTKQIVTIFSKTCDKRDKTEFIFVFCSHTQCPSKSKWVSRQNVNYTWSRTP